MSDPDRAEEERIDGAQEARHQALAELSTVMRHELATILHVARATLDTCRRGDITRAYQRLSSLGERCESALGLLDDYSGTEKTRRASRLSAAHLPVVSLFRQRRPKIHVDFEIEHEVSSLVLALPLPALTLSLHELARSFARGDSSVAVRVWTNERSADAITIAIGSAVPPAQNWSIRWVERELQRHSSRVTGPVSLVDPEGGIMTAFLLRTRVVA